MIEASITIHKILLRTSAVCMNVQKITQLGISSCHFYQKFNIRLIFLYDSSENRNPAQIQKWLPCPATVAGQVVRWCV